MLFRTISLVLSAVRRWSPEIALPTFHSLKKVKKNFISLPQRKERIRFQAPKVRKNVDC